MCWPATPRPHRRGPSPRASPHASPRVPRGSPSVRVQDYLLRNYNLYRLESCYEIREHLEENVKRLAPRCRRQTYGETNAGPSQAMAIAVAIAIAQPRACARTVSARSQMFARGGWMAGRGGGEEGVRADQLAR